MKYTKYQYKKKNNKTKFFVSLIMTLFAAGIVGLVLFKIIITFILPMSVEKVSQESTQETEIITQSKGGDVVFQFIQCGYFGKENNAKDALSKIGNEYNNFIVKQDDKFRVSAGIFKKEDGERVSQELENKGVANAKVEYVLNSGDEVQGQIVAITEGYLDIVNKLKEKDVKGVDTADFKNWTEKLPTVSKGENAELLIEYKDHIKQMGDQLKSENISSEFEYMYEILSKFPKQ